MKGIRTRFALLAATAAVAVTGLTAPGASAAPGDIPGGGINGTPECIRAVKKLQTARNEVIELKQAGVGGAELRQAKERQKAAKRSVKIKCAAD